MEKQGATRPIRVMRGRPRGFDDEQIVADSVDVFWRYGVAGATTRVLEAELGISQSSLYNTYGSKEQLLEQSLTRYEAQLAEAVLSRLDVPGRDALIDFIDAVNRWVCDAEHPGCLVMNLATEDTEHAHRLKLYRTRLRRAIRPSVRTFTSDEALVASRAELLIAATLGLNVSAKCGADRAELNRISKGIKQQIAAW